MLKDIKRKTPSGKTAEKTLREQGEQISAELKSEVEGKIEATKKAVEQDDPDVINQTSADLSQTLQKIGAEMYGAGGPGAADPEAAAGDQAAGDGEPDQSGPGDEDVVEGEFTEAN
jgi:molecular chaperone DnaK